MVAAWLLVQRLLLVQVPLLAVQYRQRCQSSKLNGTGQSSRPELELLGGDELLYGIAVAYLIANGMPLGTIAPAPHQLTELRRRIQAYLGWEGSAGSRTLSVGVVNYLQENVLAASKR